MARNKETIKKQLTDYFIQNETVQLAYGLNPAKTFEEEFSRASIENILFEAVAFCGWVLESIFDVFKKDVEDYIATMKPHTLRWYATKAKAFRYGHDLVPNEDYYTNEGYTAEQIKDAAIVHYAAVIEEPNEFGKLFLRFKLATTVSGDLAPVSAPQKAAFGVYMHRIRDAGVPLLIDSDVPDMLRQHWTIYYDPLLLDGSGNSLLGETDVVRNKIKEYVKDRLPFNGIYTRQYHEDYIQQVPGVVLCYITQNEAKHGAGSWAAIGDMYVPNAGYMRFYDEGDLTVTFVPQGVIQL